ncbi:TRIC cation channel family protein [Miniimonas sp. S16]|uniref:TRIC cation channel family protein n=1 Tax=Miniimonas sp. S16 TaxID=2171623 RepID=UPI000D529806|nr:TRIC cation channel family protein [Miniimonas sp. S16]
MDTFPLLQVPLWIEVVAIAVGALAGAAGAVRQRFDLVGVLFVAVVMGLGGGVVRDVMLGLRPVAVTNQAYVLAALGAGLGAVVLLRVVTRFVRLFGLFDALALGLFVVVGVEKAVLNGAPFTGALLIGVVAGIGGGVMRDMISGLPVQVLRRGEWNAAAAALGAALFLLLRELGTPDLLRDLLAFAVIVLARYASLLFGWQTVEAGDLWGRLARRRGLRSRGGGEDG